jgi:hypothetical protein
MGPFSNHDQRYGAGGSTLRAYRTVRESPSSVFRGWAGNVCKPDDFVGNIARHLASRDAFLEWHATLARQLESHWRKKQGRPLSFAQRFKLIDLFIKWLSEYDLGNPTLTEGFIAYANCALDRQTLAKLNECLSGALPIPAPSMGHIANENTYNFCQELVGEFAGSCGGTPLLFDYWAWKRGG